jgi:predicted nucleotidyltransferase
MRVEKDFRDFLKSLNEKKAKYLIVGGFAYSFHAEPRYTRDIDILVEATERNGGKIIAAIADFWGTEPDLQAVDFLKDDMIIQLGFAPVRIDVITSCAGIEFKSAWQNRITVKYGDICVFFISLDDLIKNKKAVGRDRDLLDVKYLERVKAAKGKSK